MRGSYFVACDTDACNSVVQMIGSDVHSFCCGLIHCDNFDIFPSDFRLHGKRIFILTDSKSFDSEPIRINPVATYMVRGQIFAGPCVLCTLESDGGLIGFSQSDAQELAILMSPCGSSDCEPIDLIDL